MTVEGVTSDVLVQSTWADDSGLIDTAFDFRTDAGGKDPDRYSPTLRQYHRMLWSKPLPSGDVFDLDDTTPNAYLHHNSRDGELFLTSDSVIPTYKTYAETQPIISKLAKEDNEAFLALAYTIGGMVVFPSVKIDRQLTINGARGLFRRKIGDRFDLTLECIRRHYIAQPSPLGETLGRYDGFFALFGDFRGYVDFFLLQDLITEGTDEVAFFMPFDDFATPAVPRDATTYLDYRRLSINFVNARNSRIQEWFSVK